MCLAALQRLVALHRGRRGRARGRVGASGELVLTLLAAREIAVEDVRGAVWDRDDAFVCD